MVRDWVPFANAGSKEGPYSNTLVEFCGEFVAGTNMPPVPGYVRGWCDDAGVVDAVVVLEFGLVGLVGAG